MAQGKGKIVELDFRVAGGASIETGSGEKILQDIKSIARKIGEQKIGIKFIANADALEKSIKSALRGKTFDINVNANVKGATATSNKTSQTAKTPSAVKSKESSKGGSSRKGPDTSEYAINNYSYKRITQTVRDIANAFSQATGEEVKWESNVANNKAAIQSLQSQRKVVIDLTDAMERASSKSDGLIYSDKELIHMSSMTSADNARKQLDALRTQFNNFDDELKSQSGLSLMFSNAERELKLFTGGSRNSMKLYDSVIQQIKAGLQQMTAEQVDAAEKAAAQAAAADSMLTNQARVAQKYGVTIDDVTAKIDQARIAFESYTKVGSEQPQITYTKDGGTVVFKTIDGLITRTVSLNKIIGDTDNAISDMLSGGFSVSTGTLSAFDKLSTKIRGISSDAAVLERVQSAVERASYAIRSVDSGSYTADDLQTIISARAELLQILEDVSVKPAPDADFAKFAYDMQSVLIVLGDTRDSISKTIGEKVNLDTRFADNKAILTGAESGRRAIVDLTDAMRLYAEEGETLTGDWFLKNADVTSSNKLQSEIDKLYTKLDKLDNSSAGWANANADLALAQKELDSILDGSSQNLDAYHARIASATDAIVKMTLAQKAASQTAPMSNMDRFLIEADIDEATLEQNIDIVRKRFEDVTGVTAKQAVVNFSNKELKLETLDGLIKKVVNLGEVANLTASSLNDMFNGKYTVNNTSKEVDKLTSKIQKLTQDHSVIASVEESAEKARSAIARIMDNTSSNPAEDIRVITTELGNLNDVIDRLSEEKAARATDIKISKLTANAQAYYNRNLAGIQSIESLDQQWSKFFADIRSGILTLDEMQEQFLELENATEVSGASVKTLDVRMRQFFRNAIETSVVMYAANAIKGLGQELYTNVQSIDTQLTQLQIVTGATESELVTMFNSARAAAIRTGNAVDDLINSQTVYARLGYSGTESATLAEYTSMLTKVGDIETADAQNAVTSIIKAFDFDISEVEFAMDQLVETGNNFPISVSQLAEGLGNAASMLQASGNSYAESLGLLAAANASVQDISKASTGLRTIAARLTDNQSVLNDLGELDTEFKYDDIVKSLTEVGVGITDQNGNLRSTYDILKDIADAYENLSETERAALAKSVAGNRQQNVLYSILGSFDDATGAVEASAESAGELAKSYDIYLNSIDGKLGQIQAKAQSISADVLNSGLVKFVLDIASGLESVVGVLAKTGTLIPTFLGVLSTNTAFSAISVTKNGVYSPIIEFVRYMSGKDAKSAIANTQQSDAIVADFVKTISGFKGISSEITSSIAAYNAGIVALGNNVDGAAQKQQALLSALQSSNPQLAAYLQGLNGASANIKDYARSLVTAQVETIGLQVATTALQAVISFGISAIIRLIVWCVKHLVTMRNRWIENGKAAQDAIDTQVARLGDLNDALDDTISAYAKLSQGVDQLTGKNSSLSTDDYQEFLNISNNIAELLPNLVRYYDINGNAVLNLSGDYQTVIQDLKEYIETAKEAANIDIANKGRSIFRGLKTEVAEYQREKSSLADLVDMFDAARQTSNDNKYYDDVSGESQYIIDPQYIADTLASISTMSDAVRNEIIKAASKDLDAAIILVNQYINQLNGYINDGYSSLRRSISAYLDTDDTFRVLSDNAQAVIKSVVNNLDFASLNFSSYDELIAYVNNLTTKLSGLDDTTYTAYLDLLTSANGGKITVAEFQQKLATLLALIGDDEEVKKAVLFSLGVENEGDVADTSGIIGEVTSALPSGLTYSTNAVKDEVTDFINGLDMDQLDDFKEFWADYEGAAFSSLEEVQEAFNEYLENLQDANDDVELNTFDFDNYEDYQDAIEDVASDIEDYGAVSKSTLDNIVEKMPEMSGVIDQYNSGVITAKELTNQLTNAYVQSALQYANAEYQKVLASGGSAQQAQQAWVNALNSLGVSYSGNGGNFANMLNGILMSNSSAVQTFLKSWNGAFSSLASGLGSLLRAAKTTYSELQTQFGQTWAGIAITTGTDTYKQYVAARTKYNQSLAALTQRIYDLETAYHAAQRINLMAGPGGGVSYVGGGGGSTGGGGGGGGGSGSGSGSSDTTDAINEAYKNAVSAYESKIKYYEWLAEKEHEALNIEGERKNWNEVLDLYREILKASQEEMNRLSALGYSYGDDLFDDAMDNYTDAADKITDIYSDMLDSILDQYKDYIDKIDDFSLFGGDAKYQLDLIQEMLDQLEDAYKHDLITYEKYLDEKTDILSDYYDAYEDYIDATADAIDDLIDKEKDSLKLQEDNLEEVQDRYKTMIDVVSELIDKRIDLLEEENDQNERAIKLEEARQELEKARENKSIRIYREGIGFTWEADAEAIREAQQAYDDLIAEYSSDDTTKKLESIKDALSKISDAYDENKNQDIATDILGSGWEDRWNEALEQIISGGDDGNAAMDALLADIARYTDSYNDVSRQLDEDVEGSVTNQIESLDKLSDAWSEFADSLDDETARYEGLLEYIKQFEGASYAERMAMLDTFSQTAVKALEDIRAKAQETTEALSAVGDKTLYEALQKQAEVVTTTAETASAAQSAAEAPAQASTTTQSTSSVWDDLPGLGYVYYGTSSSKVRRLQEALAAAGYSSYLGSSGVDGIFGSRTYQAVRAYQQANGLSVDGIAGSNTLNSLLRKLRGYSAGGVVDYTGLAILHGGKRPELVLNNADASKLYDYIHRTPDLIQAAVSGFKSNKYVSSKANSGNTNVNVTIGDLYEVNDADRLAREIRQRLPHLILQKA